MSEHLLKLSTDQLYEVYSVMWREFVALHRQATHQPLSVNAKNLVLLVRGWIAWDAKRPLFWPCLLLNVLLDDAQRCSADTSRKIAGTP